MTSFTQYLRNQPSAPAPKFESLGAEEFQERLNQVTLRLNHAAYIARQELDKTARKHASPLDYSDYVQQVEKNGYSHEEAARAAFKAMQRR